MVISQWACPKAQVCRINFASVWNSSKNSQFGLIFTFFFIFYQKRTIRQPKRKSLASRGFRFRLVSQMIPCFPTKPFNNQDNITGLLKIRSSKSVIYFRWSYLTIIYSYFFNLALSLHINFIWFGTGITGVTVSSARVSPALNEKDTWRNLGKVSRKGVRKHKLASPQPPIAIPGWRALKRE